MELKLQKVTFPEVIEFNFDELKQEITERSAAYLNLVYTDDQIKEAKKDVAALRKFTKALSDERIRVKKDLLKPYDDFESKIKELTAIVDESINNIDSQIKGYDEQKRATKKLEIDTYLIGRIPFDWLKPEQLFDEKWLNASVKMAKIEEEINQKIENIKNDLATLSNLPSFGFEATEVYKQTLNINEAIQEGKRLAEIAERKTEYEKAKATAEENTAVVAKDAAAEVEVEEDNRKMWVSFKAWVSVEDARALKRFFEDRNIEFHKI